MKRIIFLMIFCLLSIFNVASQTNKQQPIFEFKLDTTYSLFEYQIDKDSGMLKPFQDFNIKDFKLFGKNIQKQFDQRDLTFPGASKYYAKNENIISYSYSDSFIIKPDTAKNYFLIIVP